MILSEITNKTMKEMRRITGSEPREMREVNEYNAPNKTIEELINQANEQIKKENITHTVELHPGPNFGNYEEEIRLNEKFLNEILDTIDWNTVEKQKEQWGPNDWQLVLEKAGIDKERIRERSESINWEYVAVYYVLPEGFMNIFWDLLDSDYVERYQDISYEFALKHDLDIVCIVENNEKLSAENKKSFEMHYQLAKMFK